MRLRYERGALADLEEFSHTSHKTIRPQQRVSSRIEHAAERIADSPYMGEATSRPRFRRWPVGNYLIVYEVEQDEVIIHYVRHGARRRPWEDE